MKGGYPGELELLVMLAVMRLGDGAYGMTIRRELEERARREVAIGAVYAAAARLEEKGLLRSWESEPEAVRGGRARRHFELTGAGKRALRESMQRLGRMAEGTALEPLAGWH